MKAERNMAELLSILVFKPHFSSRSKNRSVNTLTQNFSHGSSGVCVKS